MIKPIIITSVALVLVLIIVLTLSPSLTSSSIYAQELAIQPSSQNQHSWTKAVCDKNNLCQDYLIECKGQEPIKISPITGTSVKFDNAWQDPRNLEQRERLC